MWKCICVCVIFNLILTIIVRSQNEAYGLVQHLGSQSICNMGFGFSTMGNF